MDKTKGQILIVDDDPHAVEILTLMLGREGYDCASAIERRRRLGQLAQPAHGCDPARRDDAGDGRSAGV